MNDHNGVGTVDVSTDEGNVGMMYEIKCGSKYTLIDDHAEYCPLCGESL